MKLKCLIVEDEPIAQDILKSYIDKTDFFEVSAQMTNAIDAFSFLQNNPVNLLFLDIKMPQMSGIELLKALSNKPKVIITSAYRDYAIEAFDLDVIDYLLKPFSFERFLKAVSKVFNDSFRQCDKSACTEIVRHREIVFFCERKQAVAKNLRR